MKSNATSTFGVSAAVVGLAVALATGARPAWAGATGASANVQVRLVSEVVAFKPGSPFTVALHMKMAPEWHTYWKNPGDSGMPTKIVWTLPDMFRAGDLQWPAPKRSVDSGLALYGYDGEATLLAEITPPVDVPRGKFTVAARVSWLECKDICIPGKANLDIVVDAGATAAPDVREAKLFAEARAAMPVKAATLRVAHTGSGSALVVRVAGEPALASPIEFFPEATGILEPSKDPKVDRAGSGWSLAFERPASAGPVLASFSGVLAAGSGSKRRTFHVTSYQEKKKP